MPFQIDYFILNFIIFITIFLSLDVLIFFMIKKKIKWINIIISSVIYLLILFVLFVFFIKKTTLHNFFNYLNVELTGSLNNFLQSEIAKGLSKEEVENLRLFFEFFIIKMIFAYIFLFVLVVVFLNYLVVRLFMINKYKIINEIPQFKMWYLDEKVIWILILALLFIILKKYLNNEVIFSITLNIIFVLANLYFLIGLSLVFFFMEKYKIPFFMQVLSVIIIISWNHLSFIIMLTGILDTWLNFRKIQKGGNLI